MGTSGLLAVCSKTNFKTNRLLKLGLLFMVTSCTVAPSSVPPQEFPLPAVVPEDSPLPEEPPPQTPDPLSPPPSDPSPTLPQETQQPLPPESPGEPPRQEESMPTQPDSTQDEAPVQVALDPPVEKPPQTIPQALAETSSIAPSLPLEPQAPPATAPSPVPAPLVAALPPVSPDPIPASPPVRLPVPPSPLPVIDEEAVRAYYQGRPERSIRTLEQHMQQDADRGNKVSITWQLARLYAELGNGKAATALIEQLHKDKPADLEVKRELFVSLCLAGNYQKARELLPLSPETGETLFYEAMLLRDTGDTGRAIATLRRSLAAENFRPIGWLFLGELLASSAPGEAETCFRTALRQDPELHVTLLPLGKVLLAQKQYKEAYESLNRAHSYFPQQDDIIQGLNEALRGIPGFPGYQESPPTRRIIGANPPKVKALGSLAQGMTLVRIGLVEEQASITVKTGGPYLLRLPGERPLFSSREPEQIWAEMRNGKLFLLDQAGKTLISAAEPVVLEYQEPENTTLVSGFTAEDRSYRGSIEFWPTQAGITLVNILNIEEYLYGVIPAEMPAYWPGEALKAQAIAARSYTLACLEDGNRDVPKEKGFDLYGSVLSAAYRGVSGEARATTAAVDATRGIYLSAGGKPLKAYYSANHGGYSEDSRSVWGYSTFNAAVPDKLLSSRTSPLPLDELARWIRERPRSYSSVPNLHSSQAYRWEKWVAAEEIRSRNAADGNSLGEILQVTSRGRGISGRINEVEIRGTQGTLRIKGDRIRSRLGGLRSNLFTIRSKLGKNGRPEYFIFQGAGWGHGVGLDQSGAAGMAQAGFTATQILSHYYPLATVH
ncbi:MAG: SpoIID/LytB domain-containing protein [Treponema sp.]|nr:SpoIID/LytB domain-containing protein [Treponema sp.]